jgi:hypothetical protein
VQTRLAFGILIGCRVFSSFGLLLAWILRRIFGLRVTVYVDDPGVVSIDAEQMS